MQSSNSLYGRHGREESKLKVNIEIQPVITITTTAMLMMMVATTGNEGNKNEIIFLEMENIKMKIRHRTWSSLLGQLGGCWLAG